MSKIKQNISHADFTPITPSPVDKPSEADTDDFTVDAHFQYIFSQDSKSGYTYMYTQ